MYCRILVPVRDAADAAGDCRHCITLMQMEHDELFWIFTLLECFLWSCHCRIMNRGISCRICLPLLWSWQCIIYVGWFSKVMVVEWFRLWYVWHGNMWCMSAIDVAAVCCVCNGYGERLCIDDMACCLLMDWMLLQGSRWCRHMVVASHGMLQYCWTCPLRQAMARTDAQHVTYGEFMIFFVAWHCIWIKHFWIFGWWIH